MEKSNDELIEDAIKLASSYKEADKSLAILYFKKVVANDNSSGKFQSVMFQIYKYFLETDLGVGSDHDTLSDFLINEIHYSGHGGRGAKLFASAKNMIDHHESLKKIVHSSPYFEYRINEFLNKELGKVWVKSLRYEVLVAQLKEWDEEDKLDSERMKKIKEIIGD
ncbi:hypothetical protein [Algoriphagus persicinus]|uniref:hypothetical protein n=1 Tax=Algoriphagus persicinus TaxID=3108754 RepID=UPI002B3E003D|nr:hypothetical protein [Algoriphagus sp. E1-3-M2]MEB2786513.1 hypothetical protein [Algoriphagus sp. E1-3-M2]